MTSHHGRERSVSAASEVLAVIKEEQKSPTGSVTLATVPSEQQNDGVEQPEFVCGCKEVLKEQLQEQYAQDLTKMLIAKEIEMELEFQKKLAKEIEYMKERFEFILRNEQIRSSFMLREAHRERQEKISALQTQLECKNLAGLMYVMCSERRRSKLGELRLHKEYTTYIKVLQHILNESQRLILHLSRGYKTAARVNHEWKLKMTKVIGEFQKFIYDFTGGTPELCQYFFDMPNLVKIEAPTEDNPEEDPCDCEDDTDLPAIEVQQEKDWWDELDQHNRPFVVFGDMAEFEAQQRREVLKAVKAIKTAPRKWKKYVFHDKFIEDKCDNLARIQDEIQNSPQEPFKWECHLQQTPQQSRVSEASRHGTPSVDYRGNMGSILKIITSTAMNATPPAKATLLGARDSMEIASVSRLRMKQIRSSSKTGKEIINVGKKIDALFANMPDDDDTFEEEEKPKESAVKIDDDDDDDDDNDNNEDDSIPSVLGSVHNDSLQVIPGHVPDQDHMINYEKVCPSENCQRLKADKFMASLPPYMRASPFTHFMQTFEEYEPCTPEQLTILKEKLEEKRRKEKLVDFHVIDVGDANEEWSQRQDGVGVQTSELFSTLPPCTCEVPAPTPVSSVGSGEVFKVADLIPIKHKLNRIDAQCFYNGAIEFDRFEVIGQDSSLYAKRDQEAYKGNRLDDLKRILKQHPSLCDIFQANIQC